MADRLKEIQVKVLEWWNKFTSKQKTIIIGIVTAVIFTFAILVYFVSKPQYTKLITCDTTAEASEVIGILESAGILYDTPTSDGLRIDVETSQLPAANLALGAAGYKPSAYSIDDVSSGGFSVTEADKQRRFVSYLEKKLASDFEYYSAIKSANVHLTIPKQDGTLIAKMEEAFAYIRLELADDSFTTENAANVARAVATALGNKTTANITIVDTNANMLFSGVEDYTTAGIASSMMDYQNQMESLVAGKVKKVLMNTGQFDTAEVAGNLVIDLTSFNKIVDEYSTKDGRDVGYPIRTETYDSENSGGSGGTPGTDSNDGTIEMYQDYSNSSSSSAEAITDYIYDHTITDLSSPAGAVIFADSSLVVAAIKFRELREEDAKTQGLLDGITWDEYKYAHQDDTQMEIGDVYYELVTNASGISKITILAYERTLFYDKASLDINTTDILSIVLIVIILAVIAFLVLNTMRSKRVVEEAEELSVENLLQSTPEIELENIELEGKSETRKMIEKFVDDNPESVANLLRNWLGEDWG